MRITFLGQSCFHIEFKEGTILIDPFITGNPLASNVDINDVQCDYVLLTHGHQDHVLDAEQIAKSNNAKVISNFEIVSWYESKGIEGHPMNHGGKWTFPFGTVRCVNAVHSSVLPDGTYGGNPMGFLIEAEDKHFYIAGDTALTLDMQLIPKFWGKLDFAILPIGGNFTMDYQDAIYASQLIDCKTIIGCHFDTFGFIKIDHDLVSKAFQEADLNLTIPKINQSIEV